MAVPLAETRVVVMAGMLADHWAATTAEWSVVSRVAYWAASTADWLAVCLVVS